MYRKGDPGIYEMEDRLFTDKEWIPDVHRYITAFHVAMVEPMGFDVLTDQVAELELLEQKAKKWKIPFYIYTKKSSWKALRSPRHRTVSGWLNAYSKEIKEPSSYRSSRGMIYEKDFKGFVATLHAVLAYRKGDTKAFEKLKKGPHKEFFYTFRGYQRDQASKLSSLIHNHKNAPQARPYFAEIRKGMLALKKRTPETLVKEMHKSVNEDANIREKKRSQDWDASERLALQLILAQKSAEKAWEQVEKRKKKGIKILVEPDSRRPVPLQMVEDNLSSYRKRVKEYGGYESWLEKSRGYIDYLPDHVKDLIVASHPNPKRKKNPVTKYGEFDPELVKLLRGPPVTPSSKAFKRWFGKSQVTNSTGKPLVVWHGTPDARWVKEGVMVNLRLDEAYFFAEDYKTALSYADDARAFDYQMAIPAVIPVYLRMLNPKVILAGGKAWGQTAHHIEQAKAEGHDGVIIYDSLDPYRHTYGHKPTNVYVVFSSNQVKLADGREGPYGETPNILNPKRPRNPKRKKNPLPLTYEDFGNRGTNRHITAVYIGMTDPRWVEMLEGLMGEHDIFRRRPTGRMSPEKWERFIASIKKEGIKYPIMVIVEWGEKGKPSKKFEELAGAYQSYTGPVDPSRDIVAHIYEGNHRVRAAIQLGIPVPIEIRFFGKSEDYLLEATSPSDLYAVRQIIHTGKPMPSTNPKRRKNPKFKIGDRVIEGKRKGKVDALHSKGTVDVIFEGMDYAIRRQQHQVKRANPGSSGMKNPVADERVDILERRETEKRLRTLRIQQTRVEEKAITESRKLKREVASEMAPRKSVTQVDRRREWQRKLREKRQKVKELHAQDGSLREQIRDTKKQIIAQDHAQQMVTDVVNMWGQALIQGGSADPDEWDGGYPGIKTSNAIVIYEPPRDNTPKGSRGPYRGFRLARTRR